jgi:hypothetical protein
VDELVDRAQLASRRVRIPLAPRRPLLGVHLLSRFRSHAGRSQSDIDAWANPSGQPAS